MLPLNLNPDPQPYGFTVSPDACDAHFHVFDQFDEFPFAADAPYIPEAAPNSDYRAMRQALGFTRSVLVQPTPYGSDNSMLLQLLARNPDYRGVAAAVAGASDADLMRLRDAGVRGLRVTSLPRGAEAASYLETLAARAAPHGLHLQLYIGKGTLLKLVDVLGQLQTPVVLDHMGGLAAADFGTEASDALLRLLQGGRVWTKLSGAERVAQAGPPYVQAQPLMRALVAAAPDRLVWGTDWPHPHLKGRPMPDDGDLLRVFGEVVHDPGLRQKILVENPASLYGFDEAM